LQFEKKDDTIGDKGTESQCKTSKINEEKRKHIPIELKQIIDHRRETRGQLVSNEFAKISSSQAVHNRRSSRLDKSLFNEYSHKTKQPSPT